MKNWLRGRRARALVRAEKKLEHIQSLIDQGGWHLNSLTYFRLNAVCRKITKLDAALKN